MTKLPAMPPVRDAYVANDPDVIALRSVALAYLEALRISVQHMEDATENGYDRRVMLDVLEYLGKLPERAV